VKEKERARIQKKRKREKEITQEEERGGSLVETGSHHRGRNQGGRGDNQRSRLQSLKLNY